VLCYFCPILTTTGMYKEVLVKTLNINFNPRASGGSPIFPFGHTDVRMNRYDESYES
jgi:hypothetical protein